MSENNILAVILAGGRSKRFGDDKSTAKLCEKTLLDDKNNIVGYVRSAAYSPSFKKVIGIAMINKPYWDNKNQFKIDINEKIFLGTVCDLPFI